MLIVGIAASMVFFYQQTGNISLIVGYIALIASFLYADYLDNHEARTRSGSRTWQSSLPSPPYPGLLYRPFPRENCPRPSSYHG